MHYNPFSFYAFRSDKETHMAKIVYFVPESSDKEFQHKQQANSTKSRISGTEARQFYEELLAEQDTIKEATKHKEVSCTRNVDKNPNKDEKTFQSSGPSLKESDFLKAAQNGDIKVLKKCLKCGINMNCVDGYGWTALMCASQSGNKRIVSYLLKKGVDVHIHDKKRRDAVFIARKAGHEDLANFITKFDCHEEKGHHRDDQNVETVEFFCDVCNKTVSQVVGENHETSTVHLFNRKLKPKPDSFLIPPGNRGYQLMLKSGWDGEKGLGSKGQGQRYPVKTILKRDRQCLGGELEKTSKKEAKITHFGPNDQNSVKRQQERKPRMATLSRRERRKQDKKSQVWERNLREEMNDLF